jgi:hypothetical protein
VRTRLWLQDGRQGKEWCEPAVVTEFASSQDLAKRVGPKAPERLKEPSDSKEANMSKTSAPNRIVLNHILSVVNELTRFFGGVGCDAPTVVLELVSIKELAQRIGEKILRKLLEQPDAVSDKAEDKMVALISVQCGKCALRVAVIDPELFVKLVEDGVMPKPKHMAIYLPGLVDWLVIAGRHAMVRFCPTLETKEDVLYWGISAGMYLRPRWLEQVEGSWHLLTWSLDRE